MQGGIEYHFLSLWYDSTWDWTQVSWAFGEHPNRKANGWNCLKNQHSESRSLTGTQNVRTEVKVSNISSNFKISFFFIIKDFRTIVFIFMVISTTFRSICPPALLRSLSNSGTFTELRTTSFIESTGGRLFWFRSPKPGTSVKYSYFVTRLQSGLNQQPTEDCLLRSLGYQRL